MPPRSPGAPGLLGAPSWPDMPSKPGASGRSDSSGNPLDIPDVVKQSSQILTSSQTYKQANKHAHTHALGSTRAHATNQPENCNQLKEQHPRTHPQSENKRAQGALEWWLNIKSRRVPTVYNLNLSWQVRLLDMEEMRQGQALGPSS